MSRDDTDKLVVAVASSALFDLSESDAVFRAEGVEAFRKHQRERLDAPPPAGPALPFIRRLLSLNAARPTAPLVEVALLSRNDAETGRRLARAFLHYDLAITRAAYTQGGDPTRFAQAFSADLFLSANADDVRRAIGAGAPAGHVSAAPTEPIVSEDPDPELRIAFDFDGVLASDAAERVYQEEGLEAFRAHETARPDEPMAPGPLLPLLRRLAAIQDAERAAAQSGAGWRPRLRIAIVTARGHAVMERVAVSLEGWGVRVDQAFFLDGAEKTAVLRELRPHVFFDDQTAHLDRAAPFVPVVHVPFGVTNAEKGFADRAGDG